MKLLLVFCDGCEGVTASKLSRHLRELGLRPGRGHPQGGKDVWAYSISNEEAELLQAAAPGSLQIQYVSEPVPYTIGQMPWLKLSKDDSRESPQK